MTISKQTVKYLRSLQLKKFRQKYANFVVEGEKVSAEALRAIPAQVEGVYALPTWIAAHTDLLAAVPQTHIHELSAHQLNQVSGLSTPNQVLLVVRHPNHPIDPSVVATSWSLVLDHIQDPGNLGTILRTADWFGIPYVFGHQCTDVYGPKAIQASMGAFLRVRYVEAHLDDLHTQFPSLPILGAYMAGTPFSQLPPPPAGFLVMGNEGQGISPDFGRLIGQRIGIPAPAHHTQGAESLNVAVATGILCAWLQGTQ